MSCCLARASRARKWLWMTLGALAIAAAMTSCDNRSAEDAGVDAGGQPDAGPDDGGVDADVPAECGNGVIDGTDECDGAALGGMDCEDVLGAGGVGTLRCNDDCTLDVSMCSICGDDTVEGAEECDGEVPAGADCASELGAGATGTLSCSSACVLDVSMCQRCGNDTAEGSEVCDGADLGGADCASRGFDGGSLGCTSACALDESGCFECGDGTISGSEQCDGTSLGGADCASQGFDGGTLACAASCAFDTSACFGCGDGTRNGAEECDAADLGGADCASRPGFDGGTLGCTSACVFDESACTSCGDGTAEGAEECDMADLRGQTCASLPGFASGILACASTCALDTSLCSTSGPPAAGQVVITEIMPDPVAISDASGEWFEVYNTGTTAVNLLGCVVSGAGGTTDSFPIMQNLVIEAGAYATFASSASPGFTPTHVWTGNFGLVNGADSISIGCDGVYSDTVHYDSSFPLLAGASMTFGPPSAIDASLNDDAARWCLATSTYGSGDRGTPGAENDRCAWTIGFCRLQFPETIDAAPGESTTVYGRVYAAGLTDMTGVNDPDARVLAAVGVGPDGSDPATDAGWTWSLAAPNAGYGPSAPGYEANNDEYVANLAAPGAAGAYDYAFRFSGNGGVDWVYCDAGAAGSSDGYAAASAGQMSVTAPAVSLTPSSITIAPTGGTAVLEVRLPTPAGAGGVTVTIESSSADIAVPASVTIPAGVIEGGIRIRSTADTGGAMITATLGADSATAGVAIGAAVAPIAGELRINEVVYAPPPAVSGDANCSGERQANNDEFVELINVSAHPIELGGVSIWEENSWMSGGGTTPRVVLAAEILGPGEALVVFGGARPSTSTVTHPWCAVVTATHLGDARAIAASMSLGLNDGGDSVFLTATNTPAVLLDSISFGMTDAPDQSFARSPEGTGAFAPFTTIADRATDRLFSPGTLNSGLGFALASAP